MYFLNCAANKGMLKLNLKDPVLKCFLIDLFTTVHKIWIELNWNWMKMNWIGIELKDSESDLNWNWIELKNPESNLNWNWIELKEMNWSEPCLSTVQFWNLHRILHETVFSNLLTSETNKYSDWTKEITNYLSKVLIKVFIYACFYIVVNIIDVTGSAVVI